MESLEHSLILNVLLRILLNHITEFICARCQLKKSYQLIDSLVKYKKMAGVAYLT